jgi:transposase
MEDWVTIRNLKKRNDELGSRKIAKLLNISRNTVRSALRRSDVPVYKRKEKVNPDIKPFQDYIHKAITVRDLRKSRILEDIRSKGYKGSKSAFYRFCDKISQQESRTFKPYETAPAEQAQFDWSPYTVVINGILTKVIVYSYIHGFSRWRVYQASFSETQASVFEALEDSIIESGGVCERLQTDNAKCFVTNSSKDNLVWNSRYLAFCGHYGIKPTRSAPVHPWSKGKVERPFDYLEQHFIKGNEFDSFEDFVDRLKQFQDTVNDRTHSTIKERPSVMFEAEQKSLMPLPQSRYVGIKEEVRKVTSDCLISYYGNRYSVPYLFATKEVWIRVSKGYFLEVYSSQNKLIAKHKLCREKGKAIIIDEHYKNHSAQKGNWQRLSEEFNFMFPDHSWFLDKLKTQKRINPAYHLTRIMDLAKYYKKDDMESAFYKCLKYNYYNAVFIKTYIEDNASEYDIEPISITPMKENQYKNINIKRSLDYYNIEGGKNGSEKQT